MRVVVEGAQVKGGRAGGFALFVPEIAESEEDAGVGPHEGVRLGEVALGLGELKLALLLVIGVAPGLTVVLRHLEFLYAHIVGREGPEGGIGGGKGDEPGSED